MTSCFYSIFINYFYWCFLLLLIFLKGNRIEKKIQRREDTSVGNFLISLLQIFLSDEKSKVDSQRSSRRVSLQNPLLGTFFIFLPGTKWKEKNVMNSTEQKVLTKIEVDNLFPSQDGNFFDQTEVRSGKFRSFVWLLKKSRILLQSSMPRRVLKLVSRELSYQHSSWHEHQLLLRRVSVPEKRKKSKVENWF